MDKMNELVKLAVDAYNGKLQKYSVGESQDALRQALVEMNNGSTKLDYKAIRDGKCPGLFSLVETILSATIVGGLVNNALFDALVDFHNVAEGDENAFVVEDANLFVVDEIAKGIQGIRRQRLVGETEISVPTSMKAVRIYEELNRVLAGRVDFNHMIDVVAQSFQRKIMDDIYALWSSATQADFGGAVYFPAAGTYNEDTLLDVIAHVEAAAGGKPATIIGTKKALRMLSSAIVADSAKEDMYNLGYYGKFNGTPVLALPQTHKVGTTTFALSDKVLHIIAGDEKPIKFVYEGNPLMIMGDPYKNADLSQEYFYGESYGLGIVLAGGNTGISRYEIL